MPRYRLLLVPLALAIVMLVGCKDPTGLPYNRVHAATLDTFAIPVNNTGNYTGDVDHYSTGIPIDGSYVTNYQDTIKWGYWESNSYPYPDQHGFAMFTVPSFNSPKGLPTCTLHYYVSGCNGNQSDSILVNNFTPAYWTWGSRSLFKAIDTSTATLAKDASPTGTGWRKIALTTQGCGIIATLGANGGGSLFTGWKYLHSPASGWYTRVVGPDVSVSPYIVVVYDPGP